MTKSQKIKIKVSTSTVSMTPTRLVNPSNYDKRVKNSRAMGKGMWVRHDGVDYGLVPTGTRRGYYTFIATGDCRFWFTFYFDGREQLDCDIAAVESWRKFLKRVGAPTSSVGRPSFNRRFRG